MLAMLIVLIFTAGFGLGYGIRAWRSKQRRGRRSMYLPYSTGPGATTFGHARRAF